jgi:hypothetical protein
MRPTPLTDEQVAQLGGGTRRVLAAPNGDLLDEHVAPLEVVIQCPDDGIQVTSLWILDDDDRAAIAAGALIKLSVIGGQPPVALEVFGA